MRITKMQFLKKKAREATGNSLRFVDVLERIYNKTRGQHNTAALTTAAKQHKGLIVCHTKKWAEELQAMEGVEATVYTDPKIWTFEGPVLMDLPCMFEFVKAHSQLEKKTTELLDFLDLRGVE